MLLFWIVDWYLVYILYNLFFKEKKISDSGQIKRSLLFLTAFVFSIFVFKDFFFLKIEIKWSLFLAGLILLTNLVFYLLQVKIGKFGKSKKTLFMFAQSADLLYQQTMIILLISLVRNFFNPTHLILTTGFIFGLMHSPLFFMNRIKYGKLYVALSFIGGWVMCYLILFVNIGYLLSYFIHYSYYLAMSLHQKDEATI
jgi:hypothetical protein